MDCVFNVNDEEAKNVEQPIAIVTHRRPKVNPKVPRASMGAKWNCDAGLDGLHRRTVVAAISLNASKSDVDDANPGDKRIESPNRKHQNSNKPKWPNSKSSQRIPSATPLMTHAVLTFRR